jgi:isocitrate dehydrogenase (NAD+)
MVKRVALIRGDGIGPEISEATVSLVNATGAQIEWVDAHAGSGALEKFGALIPQATLDTIQACDCALKGPLMTPVGGGFSSPNVALRKHFDLFANVRPARTVPGVDCRFDNVDMTVIRENTEGLYSGVEHYIPPNRSAAEAIAIITRHGSERVIRFAFEHARKTGKGKVTVFHKANILKKTTGLFLDIGREVAKEYTDIEFNDMIIDNACMQLVRSPEQFEVIVTTNLFGDIISDLAAGLIGGLGLTGSANLNLERGIFEAVHGTAPDIAGKGIANPTALMLSAAMMIESMDMADKAKAMRESLFAVLREGKTITGDLGGEATTREFTQAVIDHMTGA